MSNDEQGQKRGILTEADREYLADPDSYSRQASHKRKRKIRQRVRNAIPDFSVLVDLWGDKERADIFSSPEFSWTSHATAGVEEGPVRSIDKGLIDMVAFAWLAAQDGPRSPREVFEAGVRKSVSQEHPGYRVELHIDLTSREPDIDEAKRKLEFNEELTDGEVTALLESGDVPGDALAAYVRGEIEWPPDEE